MRGLAVVLASGGMDSCVTAALAYQTYDLAMLHVQYGQRTQEREEQAFHAIADFFQARHRLVGHLDHLKAIGGSSLTDQNMNVSEADLVRPGIPTSYVPFRNAHLLAMATSWAEVLNAERIFIGAVEEDSSGYPDCRLAFIEAFNNLIALGTKPDTQARVEAPLIALSKREIVLLGQKVKAPLHLTWSCYQATDLACGHCDSCALRLRGFFQAGVSDPIAYQNDSDRTRYTS
ncbi:MAG: 7-cyano-7-deazaguanine synthase QueC [Acidobacteria bacterium]|nr:7-cyano-7-deazaguanine synthase QueC [Acidobacteriota bacterium]MCB9399279.1 7-cyano-7-deazaguanine synthase QueC [Acidobacteriota bacterium]